MSTPSEQSDPSGLRPRLPELLSEVAPPAGKLIEAVLFAPDAAHCRHRGTVR